MRIAVFSTKPYDEKYLGLANEAHGHELVFFEARLSEETASLACGFEAVCVFVHDDLNAQVLDALHASGIQVVALRCAGFNNVDLRRADELGMTVMRVPAYSPHAVAEHTVALILALNRGICRAYNRVREGNFLLNGLLGFDLHGRTVGIIGTGRIGAVVAGIMKGFGCRLLAHDRRHNPECLDLGVQYVELDVLYQESDIITLHCPLNNESFHMIGTDAVARMKDGVMLINTSRGAVIDTQAVIAGLKSRKIGYLGLDVYEQEDNLFFEDLSNHVIQDDVFERLLTFPNVLVTGHQGYFTHDALMNIAETTLANLSCFGSDQSCGYRVNPGFIVRSAS